MEDRGWEAWDAVLDLGEVDEGAGDFDGAFGGERGSDVLVVVFGRGVEVDGVHVDEREVWARRGR